MSQILADSIKEDIKRLFNIECSATYMNKGEEHKPSKLKKREQGVYVFLKDETCCLKIGKAGLNSNSRWQYQHYRPSGAKSNLANSILNNLELVKHHYNKTEKLKINALDKENIKKWIINNISRIEFIIYGNKQEFTLTLLESFIQYKLKPLFEGNKS